MIRFDNILGYVSLPFCFASLVDFSNAAAPIIGGLAAAFSLYSQVYNHFKKKRENEEISRLKKELEDVRNKQI